ncbi:hypothetical protein N7478_005072 [Penicillium angulare]|uniref:uncharacterized protein n=1 Tax=Penicillium angulare TaxID=116970 RepID=UPI00253F6538|nr:uncharacterized protein N7478_005072 [Penicillium angulare]KAJ5279700.1 hypothetical protein N7478_005072 [Penicillium angulare]
MGLDGETIPRSIIEFQARMVNMSLLSEETGGQTSDDHLKSHLEGDIRSHRPFVRPLLLGIDCDHNQSSKIREEIHELPDNVSEICFDESIRTWSLYDESCDGYSTAGSGVSTVGNYDSEDDSLSSIPDDDFYSCCSDTLDIVFEDLPETVANCFAQLDLDCIENTHTFAPTAIKNDKIDLLGVLPTHEEIVSELAQALRIGLHSSNASQTSKSSRETSRPGTPQKRAELDLMTPEANKGVPHKLWITEKLVEHQNSAPYLRSPLSSGDVEEGGCSLASFVTKL